ncbi:amidase [Halalkalibacillus sediminis]|uniref:Amidase n=1 Tax=Halalkalibacillus sediminis TaxID=2018042 RepID=A0A2I0QVS6_9BACI|nr:amidase [Halalkalibacillus sediminis]PKR78399.1 amidase [Halalkalibacillus sediminis]
MSNLQALQHIDATRQKELIDRREISSLELTRYYIEQIEKKNQNLNAVVYEMFDEALHQVKEGKIFDGPFSGMPFLIKDLNSIKGHPATSGSEMLQNFTPTQDDEIVRRFREAGLVFLGKTNTTEFGFLPTTEPTLFGPTRNPWNTTLSAGGSSGGAAAAVASGMIPFAHASDGGGSIRIPASACGLFGFKPSRGVLPYSMYMNHLSVNHAVTRSVRDSAGLLDVLKGGTSYELYPTLDQSSSFSSSLEKPTQKLRIAYSSDFGGQVEIDQDTRQALNQTVQLLRGLGHEVVEMDPPIDFSNFTKHFMNIWLAAGSVIIDHLGKASGEEPSEKNLEPLSFNVLKEGEKLTAFTYEESRVLIQLEVQKYLSMFREFDVLLSPVMNTTPKTLGSFQSDDIHSMHTTMMEYCSFTQIANVSGQPSMSVPLHWTDEGLPVGMQFTGQIGDDADLFKLASQLENAQPWFHQYKAL